MCSKCNDADFRATPSDRRRRLEPDSRNAIAGLLVATVLGLTLAVMFGAGLYYVAKAFLPSITG